MRFRLRLPTKKQVKAEVKPNNNIKVKVEAKVKLKAKSKPNNKPNAEVKAELSTKIKAKLTNDNCKPTGFIHLTFCANELIKVFSCFQISSSIDTESSNLARAK